MPLQLPITNFVSITVTQPGAGLLPYAINNLAIFTQEVPVVTLTLGYGIYLNAASVATDWGTTSEAYQMAAAIFSQSPNIITGGGQLIIIPFLAASNLTAIMTTADTTLGLFYGGALWSGYAPTDTEVENAAVYAQAQRHILFVNSSSAAALTPTTGLFAFVKLASESQARCLYYTTTPLAARLFAAAYASRLFSVDYTGSNTAINMHAKSLATVSPDAGVSQTTLSYCLTNGIDTYPGFGGGGQSLGKVFTSGANGGFSDDIQNANWLVFSLQVAGFNALAQTATKLPQTEQGMAALKDAYVQVMNQAVTCGYLAPGSWTSPDTFGDPATLIRNVTASGFYVYSQPVALQSSANRAGRKAPIIQIAGKSAGGINSSNVLVNIIA